MHQTTVTMTTEGKGLYDITSQLQGAVSKSGVKTGLCNVFIQHTSASLVIQENADPNVLTDLAGWFSRNVTDGDSHFRHVEEGPDDMSAHVRASLTDTSTVIPVVDGRPGLGVWQGLFLFEHRAQPKRRQVIMTVYGQE